MNTLHFADITSLHLLWVLLLLAALYFYGFRQRRSALARLSVSQRSLLKASGQRRFWKAGCLLGAFVLIVIGLARPSWNLTETPVTRKGRDVVYMLDVSRSMLAEDLAPNRLERAKIAIMDSVEKLSGDRVALVAFAGRASVVCPLTTDYGFFQMALEDLSPQSVTRGGTMIGDALRTVMTEVFDAQQKEYRDIILITDGDDQESFPVEAAGKAGEQGIRLIIVGLGDEKEGRRIPITDNQGRQSFLKYQGQEVWTRLGGETLRKMALATPGGRYLPVATGNIDLGRVYLDLVAASEGRKIETKTIRRYEEKFQIFLGLALFLLCLELVIRERGRLAGERRP
ncbi:MAG: VWA domain-containing protein [Proteobacteria bacterium]|nr:VWA domain-containing protein [Pseudomonadota bacterium]MBU1688134.1 VWA domain-containing protein [Pseudomonadota bacterium]